MVTLVTVAGMLSVGLILIIAFLVIPAAAAHVDAAYAITFSRFCLYRGAEWLAGCMSECGLPKLPAGALIVLVAALFFILSLIFGREKGVLVRVIRSRALRMRVGRQHLLRPV